MYVRARTFEDTLVRRLLLQHVALWDFQQPFRVAASSWQIDTFCSRVLSVAILYDTMRTGMPGGTTPRPACHCLLVVTHSVYYF